MQNELTLSEAALGHVRRMLEKSTTEEKPIGIRLGVKKAGCSGYEYVLEYAYANSRLSSDEQFAFEEVLIIVDKAIYQKFFKRGVRMDFRKQGMKEGLVFDNPNVANQCGCGESFTLVDES